MRHQCPICRHWSDASRWQLNNLSNPDEDTRHLIEAQNAVNAEIVELQSVINGLRTKLSGLELRSSALASEIAERAL